MGVGPKPGNLMDDVRGGVGWLKNLLIGPAEANTDASKSFKEDVSKFGQAVDRLTGGPMGGPGGVGGGGGGTAASGESGGFWSGIKGAFAGRSTALGGTGEGIVSGFKSGYNAGGAQPSGDVTRGSANYMQGQHGSAGSNLTTITTASGKKVTVHKDAAPSFKGFLDELEGTGYNIKSLGGFNMRNKAGGGGLSQHAYGNAIDINPSANPFSKIFQTDMPKNVSDMAAKWGLSWGGDWKSIKDTMHFEWTGRSIKAANEAAVKSMKDAAIVQPPNPNAATAGLKNNNFGNLIATPTSLGRYAGVIGKSVNTDNAGQDRQLVFKSMEDGIKAADDLAQRRYGEGRKTINDMVAAAGGHTPGNYGAAANIAKFMGVRPDQAVDLSNPQMRSRYLAALGRQEHGTNFSPDQIDKALSRESMMAKIRSTAATVGKGVSDIVLPQAKAGSGGFDAGRFDAVKSAGDFASPGRYIGPSQTTDNSKKIDFDAIYNTSITTSEPKQAATSFQRAHEQLNSMAQRQLQGMYR